tara:strand:- start:775 stop:1062 length:288 start_codon:yes stop_codon:yes gene_type:complete
MKTILIPILLLVQIPAYSFQTKFNKNNFICYERIYQEKYIPKKLYRPSYVKIIEKDIRVNCKKVFDEKNDNNKIYKNGKIKLKEFAKWFKEKFNI